MSDDLIGKWELSRRRVLGAAAGLGLAGLPGGAFGQPGGPWSVAPKSKVDRLNFVVWTYGDIYTRIAKQFETDWGVKVNSTISSFNDHPTKLATMFAAGEKIDVSQSSPFSFPNFVNQGLAEPLDGLPGAADYIKDFTPFTKQVATIGGKTMGLPYFSAVWVWNYYADMLEKLKIDKPFTSYDEFIEHCVKAKKDGVSRYPVLWIAGVGLEQLPGTWYQMTFNRGGTFFDKQGNHMLGAGSVARETLKWWANTFEKGLDIADPESLKVQFTSGAKAFGAGKNLYRGPNHHYGLNIVQRSGAVADRRQGQGAGLAGRRQDDRRHPCLLPVVGQPRQGMGVEAAAVSRRQDQGRQLHAGRQPGQGRHAGLRLQLGDEQRRGEARLGAVGRRADAAEDLGPGVLYRRGLLVGLPAVAFPVDRSAQHRGPEMPDRADHARPVLRQPDQGHRRRQAQGLTP